jgi:hypothetical protein
VGIRQFANDMIEATNGIDDEKLKRIDQILTNKELPTLSNMREKGYKKVIQLLFRNKVKSENELRALRAYVETDILNSQEKYQTPVLMDEYEFKRT